MEVACLGREERELERSGVSCWMAAMRVVFGRARRSLARVFGRAITRLVIHSVVLLYIKYIGRLPWVALRIRYIGIVDYIRGENINET